MESLVILGAGHAGYSLAREWRKLDAATPLTILTRDDGASYYKPDLSKAFAAGKDAAGLVKASAAAMAQELNADIRTGVEVSKIDPLGRVVHAGGEPLPYGNLVLALGAVPTRLPIQGTADVPVFSVNDRQDYARFRTALRPGFKVLILGAGLIGCEFANDLSAAGYAVSVVDVARWPLSRFVPEVCGVALQNALESLGVEWHLGTSVAQFRKTAGGRTAALLGSGTTVEADVVLSAVGLRPNTSLAAAAGLHCAAGIVVDAHLRTSAEGIYALGDCIEIAGRPMPFIMPIGHAARALAPTLAGTPTCVQFPAMPTPVKTPVCPMVVCPPLATEGKWVVEGAAPDLEAVFLDSTGNPSGFALTGKATAKRGALASKLPFIAMKVMVG